MTQSRIKIIALILTFALFSTSSVFAIPGGGDDDDLLSIATVLKVAATVKAVTSIPKKVFLGKPGEDGWFVGGAGQSGLIKGGNGGSGLILGGSGGSGLLIGGSAGSGIKNGSEGESCTLM